LKVEVDLDRCEGHGICESLAPEVFELDDDDQLHYDPHPDEALRAKQPWRPTSSEPDKSCRCTTTACTYRRSMCRSMTRPERSPGEREARLDRRDALAGRGAAGRTAIRLRTRTGSAASE